MNDITKIGASHLGRAAYIYLRQSAPSVSLTKIKECRLTGVVGFQYIPIFSRAGPDLSPGPPRPGPNLRRPTAIASRGRHESLKTHGT